MKSLAERTMTKTKKLEKINVKQLMVHPFLFVAKNYKHFLIYATPLIIITTLLTTLITGDINYVTSMYPSFFYLKIAFVEIADFLLLAMFAASYSAHYLNPYVKIDFLAPFKYNKSKLLFFVNFLKIMIVITVLSVAIFTPIVFIVEAFNSVSGAIVGAILSTVAVVFIQSTVAIIAIIVPATVEGKNLSMKRAIQISKNHRKQIVLAASIIAFATLIVLLPVLSITSILTDTNIIADPILVVIVNYFEYLYVAINITFVNYLYKFFIKK